MNQPVAQQFEATLLDESQFDLLLRRLAAVYSGTGSMPAGMAPAGGPLDVTASALTPAWWQIAGRAYDIYQRRGATHGQDLADWLQAERELREAGGASSTH